MKFLENDRGGVAPVVALILPVLLAFAGLGVDASVWLGKKRNLQTAADAAAIAGAFEAAHGSDKDEIVAAAVREAVNNDFDPDKQGNTMSVVFDPDTNEVSVDISARADVFVTGALGIDDVTVNTGARARAWQGGSYCILGLDPELPGTVRTQGNPTVDSPKCGIAVNSSDVEALQIIGSADVEVGDVTVVGDYDVQGAAFFEYDSLSTGADPLDDPFEELEVPAFWPCSENDVKQPETVSGTVDPGVFCGGIRITGNDDVTFNPGVYIIDGGDFEIAGNGEITGDDGVTFILTNSGNGKYGEIKFTGGKNISLTAPTDGEFAGVTIFQDREAPDDCDNCRNMFAGNVDIEIDGALYFPSQEVVWAGEAESEAAGAGCIRIVARVVTLTGNPRMQNDCRQYPDIGLDTAPVVKLIE